MWRLVAYIYVLRLHKLVLDHLGVSSVAVVINVGWMRKSLSMYASCCIFLGIIGIVSSSVRAQPPITSVHREHLRGKSHSTLIEYATGDARSYAWSTCG